jgi:predicted regulator of Ras-like GTPase activity (Roadblock/LC7/MglB family)
VNLQEALAPLAEMAGVRFAALVTADGVPIALPGRGVGQAEFGAEADELAGLAAGWLTDTTRQTAPLSWPAPRRLVLEAARGTLVLQQSAGAVLLVIARPGLNPEDLRLPMEGAGARVERAQRGPAASPPGESRAGREPPAGRPSQAPGNANHP